MKIKSTETGILYELNISGRSDEERYLCPECSHLRKKNKDKCLSWNTTTNVGYCHNCTASFYVFNPVEPKKYIVPEWKNITELSDHSVKWFTGRMISQKTLVKMRIYTTQEYMPTRNETCEAIAFPYFFQDKLYNIKFRGLEKSFKLVSGAELIFYNQDALLNYDDIIIVEGEIDALSFIECGFDNVISVPNGAHEKMEYLDAYISLFDKIKKIYIATDQDTKGIELRDALVRRLGAERCMLVNFKDCKDANEYLINYGGSDFPLLISGAKYVPLKGIVSVDNISSDIHSLFTDGVEPGRLLNESFDQFIKWETGRLAIVTGIPSSGKSEFVDHLVMKMNIIHGWKAAYFTPENYPLKYHYAKLFEKLIGKKFARATATDMDFEMAIEHIRSNFFYIMNEEDFTVDSVITAAKVLVKSKGIKILVIDPYNRLEHQYKDSETQYISRFLDKLTGFARFNDVLVILVAHPRKMDKDSAGKLKVPSLYDINGSSNFYNKADYGFTIHRKTDARNILLNEVEVHWQKIKFKYLGQTGISELKYNYVNGRFQQNDNWDNTNWLVKNLEQQVIDYTQSHNERDEEYFDNSMPTF
jgi:twinkle protein